MKRLSNVVMVFLSISFLALTANRAVALQVEAVFGEPFGVCRIVLPLSNTEQELVSPYTFRYALFEILHQSSVYESNKRALYPIWDISAGESGSSGSKTMLFLFQGQDELDVLLSRTGFEAFREKVSIKPIENELRHFALIDEWWKAYLAKLNWIHDLDLYDPSVELGIAAMMGRRLGLLLDSFRTRSKRYYSEFDNVFGFLLGTESIRLAMQTDTMLETKGKSEIADKALPEAVLPPAMPIPPFDEIKVKVEPLAMRVPAECFYLRFGTFSAFLEAKDFLNRRGAILRSTASSRSVDYGMSKRIERQLALQETILSRYLGSSVINEVAIIGNDIFLREGAAIGILFQAKQNALLKKQLDSMRRDIMKENPSVRESFVTIDRHKISLLSSPGNEVRSFYVQDGDFHLVTTSKWMAQRFLATGKASNLSLGSLSEFRYARSQIDSSEKGIFIYLSDPFFSNLVSPAYRVEMTRRAQSVSEIQMLSLARLAAIQEDHAVTSVAFLIEKGYLPKGFGMRHDKSEPVLEEDGTATDSIRGAVGSFLPIPDITIDKITSAEAEAYKAFARAYNGIWTNMDPVFGLLSHESKSTGEQLELKLNISPYARLRYGNVFEFLGKPIYDRITMVSGDLISLELNLSISFDHFLPDLHIFGWYIDTNIPWYIRHGTTLHHIKVFIMTTFIANNVLMA